MQIAGSFSFSLWPLHTLPSKCNELSLLSLGGMPLLHKYCLACHVEEPSERWLHLIPSFLT